ncbi:MAG: lipopolysaccharide heptosyltransferase II [bacterium]
MIKSDIQHVIIIQTAFLGDVVLTLPLIQRLKQQRPNVQIDIVVIPGAATICNNHPDIQSVIIYDKRGREKGVTNLFRLAATLRRKNYDAAIIPHRSIRSALLAWLARIPIRIGFDRSAGRLLMTETVPHRWILHEIERNLTLVKPLGISASEKVLPRVYPTNEDARKVDKLLFELEIGNTKKMIALAPGSVWNTKRWLKERFASLAVNFDDAGFEIVLIGGNEDIELCLAIHALSGSSKVYTTAGKLSLLQSAELIRRCKLLVSNDSAPTHIAVAMGTPVVTIFGATVPQFGFSPAGPFDSVVQVQNLGCRPCSLHGGDKCPIKTFDCMVQISYEEVFAVARKVLQQSAMARLKTS